jgi:hypothetical protein
MAPILYRYSFTCTKLICECLAAVQYKFMKKKRKKTKRVVKYFVCRRGQSMHYIRKRSSIVRYVEHVSLYE